MNLETARIEQNEIVKSSDFTFAFDSLASNIALAIRKFIGATSFDVLIGGSVTPDPLGSMNLFLSGVFAVGNNSFALDTEQVGPIGVAPASAQDRYDTLQIRGVFAGFDNQQRGFYDTDTDIVTYNFIDTKKRFIVEAVVKNGTPGSVSAPTTDDGWIKIAEILVLAETEQISVENIYGITADSDGQENALWTNEKNRSYRVGGLSENRALFRIQHNANGGHNDGVILSSNLKIGTDTGSLNGALIPLGSIESIDSVEYPETTTIPNVVTAIISYANTIKEFCDSLDSSLATETENRENADSAVASMAESALSAHRLDKTNPHDVTKEQLGIFTQFSMVAKTISVEESPRTITLASLDLPILGEGRIYDLMLQLYGANSEIANLSVEVFTDSIIIHTYTIKNGTMKEEVPTLKLGSFLLGQNVIGAKSILSIKAYFTS